MIPPPPLTDAARLRRRLEALAWIGADPSGGISRLAFTEADRAARAWLERELAGSGLAVRCDAAGNLHARRPGRDPGAAPILFGSHIDTVPRAGAFDGALGVLAGVELLASLEERGLETRHPLELVVWADEEGVSFGRGLFGSRAAALGVRPGELEAEDRGGVSLAEWLRRYGQDPAALDAARLQPRDATAYFELHVEQGPHLDRAGLEIGVVEGIVAIERWDVRIEGATNHAGTTPMAERRDALVAAALLTRAVREEVMARAGDQVGNVGLIEVPSGAPNVVPGLVRLPIELRDMDPGVIAETMERIRRRGAAIEAETGTRIAIAGVGAEPPAPTDPGLRDLIESQARAAGLTTRRMKSGAGHDAQNVARGGIPTGMIFVRSRAGISHAPEEWTDAEDCHRGAELLARCVLACDGA